MAWARSDDVLVSHLEGEAILLHMGTKAYHRLNETGAFLWSQVEAGRPMDELLSELCTTFGVEEGEARREAERFFAELEERGLIRPANSGSG